MNIRSIILILILASLLGILNGCKDNSSTPPPASSRMNLIGSYGTNGYAQGICAHTINSNIYAFIADGSNGLDIVKVTNPAMPQIASNYNTQGTAVNVTVTSINGIYYAFVCDGIQGFDIFNVSDPYSPVLDTIISFPNDVVLTSFVDSTAKIAYIGSFYGMYIYDLHNLPDAVNRLSYYSTFDHILGIDVVNGTAYLAEATIGLEIVNVGNPVTPSYLSVYDTPGYANDVKISLNKAYIADGGDGILVIDITNVFEPNLVGMVSTEGAIYFGLSLNGTQLYSASDGYGAETFSISTPNSPVQAGYYNTSKDVTGVFYYHGYLYAANTYNGMLILAFQ
jgi:hypothetical protein